MMVVALVGGVIVVAFVAWYVVEQRRIREAQRVVTPQWLSEHKYKRDGDPQ